MLIKKQKYFKAFPFRKVEQNKILEQKMISNLLDVSLDDETVLNFKTQVCKKGN